VRLKLSIGLLTFLSLFVLCTSSFAQGEGLFKAKCATCHAVFKNGTGPKLYEARKRWEDAGEGEFIYEWVRNNGALRASGKSQRALEVFQEYKGSVMSIFADLSDEQINSILDWVDSQDPNAAVAAVPGAPSAAGVEAGEEEKGLPWTWIIVGVMFSIVIMAVGGVRRQLKIATKESPAEEVEGLTYIDEFKIWAWKYRLYVGLCTLVLVISSIVGLFLNPI
jgi:mono/diheme cytochrome c family protein